MANTAKQERRTQSALAERIETLARQMAVPFDAYRLARLTGAAPMDVGRALVALARQGRLRSLGDGPEGHLAERYVSA